jgi:hypothetical protein
MNASDWNLSTDATLRKVDNWGIYVVITVVDLHLNTVVQTYTVKLPSDKLHDLWQKCLNMIGNPDEWNTPLEFKIPLDNQSVIIPFNSVSKSINFKLVVFNPEMPLLEFVCKMGTYTWSITKQSIEVGDNMLEDRFFSMKTTLGRMCNDIVTDGEVMALPINKGITAIKINALRQFAPTKPIEYPKPPANVRLNHHIVIELTPHQLLASFQKRLLNERLQKSVL